MLVAGNELHNVLPEGMQMGQRSRRSLSLLCLAIFASSCATEDEVVDRPKSEPVMPGDIKDAVDTMQAEVMVLDPEGIPLHVNGNFGRIDVAADGRVMAGAMEPTLELIAPMFRLRSDNLVFQRMDT